MKCIHDVMPPLDGVMLCTGVGTFVCLQEEYPDDSLPESEWRSGKAIRPYFEDLKLIIKNKKMFSALAGYDTIGR